MCGGNNANNYAVTQINAPAHFQQTTKTTYLDDLFI